MGKHLLLCLFLLSFTAHSQDPEHRELLSLAIGKNIKKYVKNSKQAYADKDFERAEFLFDSLITHVINGSYLDNFRVRKLSGKTVRFYDFKKPTFLMTYASWCTPGVGEIPALNKVADKYYKEIDFIILFWDTKDHVKEVAKAYSKNINVVYVDEFENTHDHIIEAMKHSLGFPTSFFLDADKRVLDVRRGVLHPYNEAFEISYELNYDAFRNGISLLTNFSQEQTVIAKESPEDY